MKTLSPKIQTEVREETVATGYHDQWSESIRIQYKDRKEQIEISVNQLENLCDRRNYTVEEKGYSTSSLRIYKRHEKKVCRYCDSKAMFDNYSNSYYCPMCELK